MSGPEAVDHPAHYGGAGNPYEAIKVIDAWGLGFCLGNTIKYIARAGKKDAALQDLKKAPVRRARSIRDSRLRRGDERSCPTDRPGMPNRMGK